MIKFLRRNALPLAFVVFMATLVAGVAWADPPPPDTTPPVLSLPGDQSASTTNPAGTSVTFSVSATDDVDGSVPVTCAPASGFAFPVGTTPVTCFAKDAANNVATGGFNVIVTLSDTTKPVLSLPADINASATSASGAAVSYSASANDNVDGPVAVNCDHASGSTFPIGTTTVSCSATDSHSNTANGSFKVTVKDTTAPSLSLPGNINAAASNSSGATVNYSASASDNVDGSVAVSCNHDSGSTFGFGTTTVNCSAHDAAGNTSNGSFTVTVSDTVKPTLNLPADIDTTITAPGGKTVTYTATATDNIDGSVTVNCSPASGSSFPVGTTTVNCSASDAHGNTANGSFKVTVRLVDTIAPVLSLPSDINTTTTVAGGIAVTYSASATDNIDGTIPVSCDHGSGSTFPVGTTTVNCSATDAHGNRANGSFRVTVRLVDTTAPALSLPGDISTTTTDPGGKAVSYAAAATDNIDGSVPVSCDHTSGSAFPVGTTTVSCSATDAHGNRATASFKVTVVLIDNTPPVLSNVPGDITREADGPAGSVVTFSTPTATDNLDGPLPNVTCTPAAGSRFPVGTTTVVCSATDAHGNKGSATFKVIVRDTEPPVLFVPPPLTVAADASGTVSVLNGTVQNWKNSAKATDKVDPTPLLTNNIPETIPLGVTTVNFATRDKAGNSASKNVTITVLAPGKPAPSPPAVKAPPPDVAGLAATPGNGRVTVKWAKPGNASVGRYDLMRSEGAQPQTRLYSGKGTSFVDKKVKNGIEYRYVVILFDPDGNRSLGVSVLAIPKAPFLRNVKEGARVKLPAVFKWSASVGAGYYNAQVFCAGAKVLSAWPLKPSLVLQRRVKYQGASHVIQGACILYVWPGIGTRADAKYGPLLGAAHFVAR